MNYSNERKVQKQDIEILLVSKVLQYWTDRIAQNASLWSKNTLITGGVGGAGVDPPS